MIAFWSWMILFGHDLRFFKLDKPSLTPPTPKLGHFFQKFSQSKFMPVKIPNMEFDNVELYGNGSSRTE